jgi:LPXTG-site transpeptidase (sortase) family protein
VNLNDLSRRSIFGGLVVAGALLSACAKAVSPSRQETAEAVEPPAPTPTATKIPATAGRRPPKIEPLVLPPVRIRIPVLNVEAPVKEVGLDAHGDLIVPTDADTVVWFGASAPPGLAGNAIMAGHTDWNGKLGTFFRLKDLDKGATVEVQASDGAKRTFSVTEKQLYPVDNAPVEFIFAATPKPVLTMITCGGSFNQIRHDYTHRVVVRAELAA